jgi:hypothetical protein
MNLYWQQLVAGAMQYETRRNEHRSSNPAELVMEIRRPGSAGLTASDISVALRLDHAHVVQRCRGPREATAAAATGRAWQGRPTYSQRCRRK